MKSPLFSFPAGADLPMTGERYIPGIQGPIQLEHFHRYLFALRFAEGRDLIDVASGEGYGSALLAQVAKTVIGVDLDPVAVANANRRYASQMLIFRVGDATQLPCDSNSSDLVVSFETIEHLEDHEAFLSEVKRVLQDGGLLIVSTPDKPQYDATLAEPNPFHRKELNRAEFESLLRKYFQNVRLFEQRSLHGSVMMSADDEKATGGLEFFHSSNGSNFQRIEDKMNSPFLIALASDNELPRCMASVMDSPAEIEKLRGDFGYATGEMWRLHAVESKYLESKEQISHLREELKKTKALADLARAESRHLRSKMRK